MESLQQMPQMQGKLQGQLQELLTLFCCPSVDGAISVPPHLQPPTALPPVLIPLVIWHMGTRADPKVTVSSVMAENLQQLCPPW